MGGERVRGMRNGCGRVRRGSECTDDVWQKHPGQGEGEEDNRG